MTGDAASVEKKLAVWDWLRQLHSVQRIRKAHKMQPSIKDYDQLLDSFRDFVRGTLIEVGVPPEEIV